MMKILMAVFFLTMAFLSKSWGKHYLVETKDFKDRDDTDGQDFNARSLINRMWSLNQLVALNRLPLWRQQRILGNIDRIIRNSRNGLMDFNLGEVEINKRNCYRR